jgi:D-alanyl-D-alanine carboxypeptidase (penicillin-binding protein 5/6)
MGSRLAAKGAELRIIGRLASAVTILLAAALAAFCVSVPAARAAAPAAAATTSGPAGVAAPWALLANESTGKWLWSRAPTVERPMGSITKIMTAYVVIETGGLNRVITVPNGIIAYDHKFDASNAGLVPGEKLTALQLLYAMLLPSGCDAAFTLAQAYGPGWNNFIAKMNATAKKLGLTRTHFTDAAGLPNPGQYTNYSTARDLVVMGRAAMRLPLLRQIVGTFSYHVASGSGHNAHTWPNSNELISQHYPGAIGIKPGGTAAAGACLLFAAQRGAQILIGVVLHSSQWWIDGNTKDAVKVLNWGFAHFS